MIIVKSYAKNNGKIQQRQRVQYESTEKAMEDFNRKMDLVEKGYNEQLKRLNIEKIKRDRKETPNKVIERFYNSVINETVYVLEFETK